MQPTILGLFVVALGLWCQFGTYQRTVVAMFGLVVLGAASALDLPALGGSSVTPANLFLVFLIVRLVSMRGGGSALAAEIAPGRPLFIFLLLVLWIIGSALLLPRLFDGSVTVFSLSRALDNDGGTMPLHPTSGNLSQSIYAIGGFLVACAISAFGRKPGGLRTILSALILTTWLDIGFAVIDLVTSWTHTGFLLDPIHNGGYALLTDDELGGLKRIAGSFSEASGFATFSLTLLGANFALFVLGVRPRHTGPASLLLTGFVVLSTSSAGYLGLAVFYALFAVYAVVTALIGGRARALRIAAAGLGVGALAVCAVVLFVPSVANTAMAVINDSLLSKGTSESGIERGSWNTQAWQVFQDTHWLGAGIGSTRGSNYALVLLSNLGAIGFVLFVLLVLRVVLSRTVVSLDGEERGIVWSARIGLLTSLIPSLVIGTVYDLGALFYCLVGVAASGCIIARRPAVARSRSGSRDSATISNASFSGRRHPDRTTGLGAWRMRA